MAIIKEALVNRRIPALLLVVLMVATATSAGSPFDTFKLFDNDTVGVYGNAVDVSLYSMASGGCDVFVSDNTSLSALSIALYTNECLSTSSYCSNDDVVFLNRFSPVAALTYSMTAAELAAGTGNFLTNSLTGLRVIAQLTAKTSGVFANVRVQCSWSKY